MHHYEAYIRENLESIRVSKCKGTAEEVRVQIPSQDMVTVVNNYPY